MRTLFWGGLILLDILWIVLSGLYFKVFFKSAFLKKLKLFLYVVYEEYKNMIRTDYVLFWYLLFRIKFFECFFWPLRALPPEFSKSRSATCWKLVARSLEDCIFILDEINLSEGLHRGIINFSREIRKEQSCSISSGRDSGHKLMASLRLELEESSAR